MESKVVQLFIGYDQREAVAFNVLSHSVQRLASRPVSITPLLLSQLKGVITRERHPLQSTDFAFSRFLVPYLCNFKGWAIFMDCDMLLVDDIVKLWELRDEKYAVQVVKHSQKPKESLKFLNQPQTPYEKKNWSSVMLINCERCKALTPEYVNTASGLQLHQFKWLNNDELIGTIDKRWNYLAGVDPTIAETKISNIHYTIGGPYFERYKNCDYADIWFAERDRMLHADNT
ncbi:MAG: glycosyltransferase [Magnetococcales bacterium]|nr:glycosyltransferase [Magnetococcales bacterium]